MTIPKPSSRAAVSCVGVAMLFLAVLSVGCSGDGQTAASTVSEGETVVRTFGFRPSWDVEDMVKRSDAVVIAMLSRDLGTKQQPEFNDPPRFNYEYKDYELTVEEVIYSRANLPERIAILVEAGTSAVPAVDGSIVEVVGMDDIPTLQANERMLLFLESLEDPKFSESPGRPVPKGFTESTYFRVIIGSQFAKLLPEGDEWKDTRSNETFTIAQLRTLLIEAIQRRTRRYESSQASVRT